MKLLLLIITLLPLMARGQQQMLINPPALAATNSGTVSPVDPTNIIAWWTLDNTSGTDSSGNGHTGTFSGGTETAVTGQITNGVQFSGADPKMGFSSVATSGNTFTISFWINFANAAGINYQTILWDSAGFGLFMHSGGNLDMYDGSDHLNNTVLSGSTWYYCAITVSSGSGTFYLNGVADGTFSFAHSPAFAVLGSENPGNPIGGGVSTGILDNFTIYGVSESAANIGQVYTNGLNHLP